MKMSVKMEQRNKTTWIHKFSASACSFSSEDVVTPLNNINFSWKCAEMSCKSYVSVESYQSEDLCYLLSWQCKLLL